MAMPQSQKNMTTKSVYIHVGLHFSIMLTAQSNFNPLIYAAYSDRS